MSATKLLCALFFVLGLSGVACGCVITYGGTLSNADGDLFGTGPWSAGASISWTVAPLSDNQWRYQYHFTLPGKDISHVILETSSLFHASDASAFAWSDNGDGWSDFVLQDDENVKTQLLSQGNPGMPEAMYGIKFEPPSPTDDLSIRFTTDFAPGWGDAYAKSGKVRGQDVVAYNSGFGPGDVDPTSPYSSGSVQDHLLIPGVEFVPMPRPCRCC